MRQKGPERDELIRFYLTSDRPILHGILPPFPADQSDNREKKVAVLTVSKLGYSGYPRCIYISLPVTLPTMASTDDDPVIASYDVFLTDSEISRYVLQYMDRHESLPYNERRGQKPTALRMKPSTGLVEVDVPINTRESYVADKGLRYGEAMKKSRSARDGGAYGMAGGFTAGSLAAGGARVKSEGNGDIEVLDKKKIVDTSSLIRTQSLGGRIKPPEEGDPVYMLATFKGSKFRESLQSPVFC